MSAPDTRPAAEKLRRVVLNRLHAFETGERVVDGTGANGGPCTVCGPRAAAVLRAVVETLGITHAMADDLDFTDGFEDVGAALATLLTAAEVPND